MEIERDWLRRNRKSVLPDEHDERGDCYSNMAVECTPYGTTRVDIFSPSSNVELLRARFCTAERWTKYKIRKFWPPSLAGLTCYQFVRAKRFTKWDYRASSRFSLYGRIPRLLDEESKRIFFIDIVAEACERINLPDASRPQSRLCSLFQRCECPFSSIRVIFNARSTNLKRLPRRHFGFAVFPDQFYNFYIAESWKEIGGRRWSCMFYSA